MSHVVAEFVVDASGKIFVEEELCLASLRINHAQGVQQRNCPQGWTASVLPQYAHINCQPETSGNTLVFR